MAEGNIEDDGNLSLIPSSETFEDLANSMPETSTRYGSVNLGSGCVLSPGGHSFGERIRNTSVRQYRRMTHVSKKTVVHRHAEAPVSKSVDEDDPIGSRRRVPKYMEVMSSCNVPPGAEIRRKAGAGSGNIKNVYDEVMRVKTADEVRHQMLDRLRSEYIRASAEHVAATSSGRRASGDVDENSPLLSESYGEEVSHECLPFTRPVHDLPAGFFRLHVPGVGKLLHLEPEDESQKVGSVTTVLSLWNTMMGTSMLSTPWAVKEAGLVGSVVIGLGMTGICSVTAIIIVKMEEKLKSQGHNVPEFAQLCGKVLGPVYEKLSGFTSLLAVLGAAMVYWVLMSNFLFETVSYGHDAMEGNLPNNTPAIMCPKNHTHLDSDEVDDVNHLGFVPAAIHTWTLFERVWNRKTVPVFMLLIYPLLCLRDVGFFTKFNSLGTCSVFFVFFLNIYWLVKFGINANFKDKSSDSYVPLVNSRFPSLSGMLALGLFIHNAIITIVRNNKNPANNVRDLIIAFVLVSFTYMGIGTNFYLLFPLPKWCIEDNLLDNFSNYDLMIVVCRAFLFLQLNCVFPLIMYILRFQTFQLFNLRNCPANIMLINAVVVVICVCTAIFFPKIGGIIRYSGALCGFIMIFTLPVLVKLKDLQNDGRRKPYHLIIGGVVISIGFANLVAQFTF